MSLDLIDYRQQARESIRLFWTRRDEAKVRQQQRGVIDIGGRSEVTSGRTMDGFVGLARSLVVANGLPESSVFSGLDLKNRSSRCITLPGFYRPLKDWDLVVIHRGMLVAAIEFKSQVGPSFGNNFNNRCEEAIGTAADLWLAFREQMFLDSPRPFLGYLILLEDCEASRKPIRRKAGHFTMSPEFEHSSYATCYEILCRRMVQERLFESAALLLSSRNSTETGAYTEMSDRTGLHQFAASLAGHIAKAAALYP